MSNLSVTSTSLSVAENSLATPIGMAAPTAVDYASSALTVTVTELPTDGIVLFADDITPVAIGETLTVAQLTGLRFRPVTNGASLSSNFGFIVSDPAGNSASGTATLAIGSSTTPLLTTPTFLTEPQNGTTSPIGIAAPVDINYAASALTVKLTALPSNGTVQLSNGTAVTVGETLTVAQLTGLVFKPGTGSSQSSIHFESHIQRLGPRRQYGHRSRSHKRNAGHAARNRPGFADRGAEQLGDAHRHPGAHGR